MKKRRWAFLSLFTLSTFSIVLLLVVRNTQAENRAPVLPPTEPSVAQIVSSPTVTAYLPYVTRTGQIPLQPEDLVYVGAFRLPDGPDELAWMWSGEALTYRPDGDSGSSDDYPGSLFGTGHNWNQYLSEISVPVPVVSAGKNLAELNTATTLQAFQNVRGSLYDHLDFEIPRAGLAYLPAQGAQTTPKLHFSWADHAPGNEYDTGPTHGWCELNLGAPQSSGIWRIASYRKYVTADYLFDIPQGWADAFTPGKLLATGRFRDGGQASQGPSLFAYGPWSEGNPPASGTQLDAVPLLLYSDIFAAEQHPLDNYHHSDQWTGGVWATLGAKAAVIIVGTKGGGDCWYGYADGTVWPDEPPYPPVPDPPNDDRGWWSTTFDGQLFFYNTDDLAAVASGEMPAWQPQPYASLNVDEHLYHVTSTRQRYHLGAAAYDRERGLLYVIEPLADEDKSIIHVWQVQ